MALAKITLFGMARWLNNLTPADDLFKNMTLPTGLDKSKLVDVIMLRGGEFGVLYADPYFMQTMIGVWSQKYQHTFERWVKALAIDYNPLENYDRMESWTDAGDRAKSDSRTHHAERASDADRATVDSASRSGSNADSTKESNAVTMAAKEETSNSQMTDTVSGANKTTSGTDETKVSAFDSSSYQPSQKVESSGSETDNGMTHTGTEGGTTVDGHTQSVASRETSGGSDHSENENRVGRATDAEKETAHESTAGGEREHTANVRTGRAHGNIGVTTSQQMLESEWEVARLNIYEEAAELFLAEFCIYVY